MSSAGPPIRGLEHLSATLATFGPAIEQLEEQTRSFAVVGAAIAQHVNSTAVRQHLGFAPLATKLAEIAAAIDRVESKRRRVVCKLGRGAANRADVLAGIDRLSLEALEEILEASLAGDYPEELEPARERLAWYRSAIRQRGRLERAECKRREVRVRVGTRELSERNPRTARTHSRPVGSLAPPRSSDSQLVTQLPRGRPPM